MSGLHDIWQNSGDKIPEDKLAAYLEGKLSPEEQHEMERLLADEGMESDAVEGLKELSNSETKAAVKNLNYFLRRKLDTERYKRRKSIKSNPWALIAITVILILIIIAYFVIRMIIVKQ